MNSHTRQRWLAGGILAATLSAGSAMAADYTTIVQDITVDRAADLVWQKIGGYCDISAWLNVSCLYTSGSGDLGTVRRLNDRVDEVMVAKTLHSYTYTQPASTILYHGTLDVQAIGANRSKIVYTLFYDQSALPSDEARAADRDQRSKRFATALTTMKSLAEAP